jgi:hypothetical protein
MRISATAVLLLSLLLVISLSSCSKQSATDGAGGIGGAADMLIDETVEPVTDAAEATESAADVPMAEAIVEEVGAPLYEGAQPAAEEAQVEDDKTLATYTTDASYKDVKAFYMEKLQAPDWSNNGFELGPIGGYEWEFKSADETRLVLVRSESSSAKTEIRFTVQKQ